MKPILLLLGVLFLVHSSTQEFFFPGMSACEEENCAPNEEPWREPCKVSTSFSMIAEPLVYNHTTNKLDMFGLIWMWYDFPQQKIRLDSIVSKYGKNVKMSMWILFKEKKVYRFDREGTKCKSFRFQGDMKKPMIPSNATFLTTLQRGTEVLEMWKIPITKQKQGADAKMKKLLIIENTVGTCVPVTMDIFLMNEQDDSAAQNRDYTKLKPWVLVPIVNYMSGVSPYNFDLPKQCDALTVEDTPAFDFDEENWWMQMSNIMMVKMTQ